MRARWLARLYNMGRTSKFSFSLPGRKTSVATTSEEKREPSQWHPSTASQNNLSMSKVERLLGTTGLPVRPSPSYDTLERATLNSKPSYMSLAVSESSGHRHTESAGHGAHYRPPRYQSLRHQASSGVLGRSGHLVDQVADSSVSLNTRDLRSERSSATLRSYYDAYKAPLLVSQQTSNSAVRDMALRKGLDPVVPPEQQEHTDAGPQDPRMRRQHSTTPSFASTALETRQRNLDLTNFFPRPRKPSGHALGAEGIVNSPSQLSLSSEFPAQRRQNNANEVPARQNSRTRAVLQKTQPEQSRHVKRPSNVQVLRRDDPSENPKSHVRRPPKGIQNWFDGMVEEVDEEFDTEDGEPPPIEPQYQPQPQTTLRSVPSSPSTASEQPAEHPSGPSRYFNNHSGGDRPPTRDRHRLNNPLMSHPPDRQNRVSTLLRSVDVDNDARFGASDTSDESIRSASDSESPVHAIRHQPLNGASPSGKPVQTRQLASTGSVKRHSLASHNTLASGVSKAERLPDNLRSSSALSLSSVEDQGDIDDNDGDARMPRVRDSIAISEISADDVQFGRARAFEIRPSGRRLNDFRRAPRPMVLREFTASDIAEELPPEPRSAGPTTTVARPEQLLSPLDGSDGPHEPPRPHTSAASVPFTDATARASTGGDEAMISSDAMGHKLMAVTPEEEALLEMMRSKRVAMAEHSFQEGYQTALAQEQRRKLSEPPDANHESLLAAVEAVVQASAARQQGLVANAQAQRPTNPSPPTLTDKDEAESEITAESTFTDIMDAFPAPSPTNNRFSTTFVPRAEQRNTSPGFSAASSSRHGRTKRHSNLSTVSSSMEDTSGTSATSSSPLPKQQDGDTGSLSGDTSNASTIKRQEAAKRLSSLGPVRTSMGSAASKSTEQLASGGPVLPATTPGEQEYDRFGELMIGASESIVGNNDTDDLGLASPLASPPIQSATVQDPLNKVDKRRSMRIDVSAEPPSQPPTNAAPESPRKLPEKRASRGAEYRLTPRISQPSPTGANFPLKIQPNGRAFSAPVPPQLTHSSSNASVNGRLRVGSVGSSPARNSQEVSSTDGKTKPDAINIANVKSTFSPHRDPSPHTAPLPNNQLPMLEKRPSKRFSRSSLHSESERLSKRFSLASLQSETRLSKRFSKSSVPSRAFEEGGQRSSVSEDVLNAWTNLGGWRAFESLRGEA